MRMLRIYLEVGFDGDPSFEFELRAVDRDPKNGFGTGTVARIELPLGYILHTWATDLAGGTVTTWALIGPGREAMDAVHDWIVPDVERALQVGPWILFYRAEVREKFGLPSLDDYGLPSDPGGE